MKKTEIAYRDLEKPRRCLNCGIMFPSQSPANRFCPRCKKSRGSTRGALEVLPLDCLVRIPDSFKNPIGSMDCQDELPVRRAMRRRRIFQGSRKSSR